MPKSFFAEEIYIDNVHNQSKVWTQLVSQIKSQTKTK